MWIFLSPILSPKNNPMFALAPARDTVLYCVLTCLARACATCVSLLKWGSTRACVRDWIILWDHITTPLR